MSPFVLHSILGSPYGRAVAMMLEEKGASWRLVPIRPGAHRQREHLARHPFGRVPVLEHDGFRLFETQAILRYLDRLSPQPGLTPADPRAAAMMDQAMNVTDCYLFREVGAEIAFQRVVLPQFLGSVADEAVVAAAMPRAHVVFEAIARLLGANPFLAGDALSLADLHMAPHMAMLAATPEWAELTAERPDLIAWLARLEQRPSFAATTFENLRALAIAA